TEMVPYARAEGRALLATRFGAVGTSLSMRGTGNLVGGERRGKGAAGSLRAEAALPLVRSFASDDSSDPWRHRLEPQVSITGLAVHADDTLATDFGRTRDFGVSLPSTGGGAVNGGTWVSEAGLSSAIGRWG